MKRFYNPRCEGKHLISEDIFWKQKTLQMIAHALARPDAKTHVIPLKHLYLLANSTFVWLVFKTNGKWLIAYYRVSNALGIIAKRTTAQGMGYKGWVKVQ